MAIRSELEATPKLVLGKEDRPAWTGRDNVVECRRELQVRTTVQTGCGGGNGDALWWSWEHIEYSCSFDRAICLQARGDRDKSRVRRGCELARGRDLPICD